MRSHCSRCAAAAISRAGSPLARIASVSKPSRSSPRGHALEIRAVALNLLALAQVELIDVARRPAVGDVDQDERRIAEARELAHVVEDRLVVGRVLEGNQNALVHDQPPPREKSARSATR